MLIALYLNYIHNQTYLNYILMDYHVNIFITLLIILMVDADLVNHHLVLLQMYFYQNKAMTYLNLIHF